MFKRTLGAIALVASALVAPDAQAVIFCVESTAQFESALATAGANGVPDRVLLALPQFTAPAGSFHYSNAGINETLTIEGGYGPQCSTHPAGAKSIISGENVVANGALLINAFRSQVVIQDLVFVQYTAIDDFSAALKIEGDEVDVLVQRSGAYFNEGTMRSAIWIVGVGGNVVLRNNVIAANRSDEMVVQVSGRDATPGEEMQSCVVVNNTYASNAAITAGANATFSLFGCAESLVANNIFWGNAGSDLYIGGFFRPVELIANDIEDLALGLVTQPVETGTLHTDPMFEAGIFDFSLTAFSPLVDAGASDDEWLADSPDYRGGARMSGASPDIGAIERQGNIFANGFEN